MPLTNNSNKKLCLTHITISRSGRHQLVRRILMSMLLTVIGIVPVHADETTTLYPQLKSPSAQTIGGNWKVIHKDKSNKQIHEIYVVMTPPTSRICERKDESYCYYHETDNAGGEWHSHYTSDYVYPREFKITSPGHMKYDHAYLFAKFNWGLDGSITFQGDQGTGSWEYDEDNYGTEHWQKLLPRIDKVGFGTPDQPSDSPTSVVGYGTVGHVSGIYGGLWHNKYDIRGARPTFDITLYGDNLWGFHIADFKDSPGFEADISQCDGIYTGDSREVEDHIGLRCRIVLMPGITSGSKILRFDNLEIPFDFVINGLSNEIKATVSIPTEWRYHSGEPDTLLVDLPKSDIAWTTDGNSEKDWAYLNINVTGDNLAGVTQDQISFANKNLKLKSMWHSEYGLALAATLLPQAQQGPTSLSIGGSTAPFTFEYGGGFPDLAISNETYNPSLRHLPTFAFRNLTVPAESSTIIAKITNSGEISGDSLLLKIGQSDSTVSCESCKAAVKVCDESGSNCKHCEIKPTQLDNEAEGAIAGSEYLCKGHKLEPGDKSYVVMAFSRDYVNQYSTSETNKDGIQCKSDKKISLYAFGYSDDLLNEKNEADNMTDFSISSLIPLLDEIELLGVPISAGTDKQQAIRDYNERIYHYENRQVGGPLEWISSIFRQYEKGNPYPLTDLYPYALYKIRISLKQPVCDQGQMDALDLLVRKTHRDRPDTMQSVSVKLSDDKTYLLSEEIISDEAGTQYDFRVGKASLNIGVEELPSGVFSINANDKSLDELRSVDEAGLYTIKLAIPDVDLRNVFYVYLGGQFIDENKKDQPGSDEAKVSNKFAFELNNAGQGVFDFGHNMLPGYIGRVGWVIVVSSRKHNLIQAGFDRLKIVSADEDFYGLDGLIFTEKSTAMAIDLATVDDELVVRAKFKEKAPLEGQIMLSILRVGNSTAEWSVDGNRSRDLHVLTTDPIKLDELTEQYGLAVGDILRATWGDDKDHAASLQVAGTPGKAKSITVKQFEQEVSEIRLGEKFTVEVGFEKVPQKDQYLRYSIRSSSKVQRDANVLKWRALSNRQSDSEALVAEFLVQKYGRSGGYNSAFVGDELFLSYAGIRKTLGFVAGQNDSKKSITVKASNAFGHPFDAAGTLRAIGKDHVWDFITHRPVEVPTGQYRLELDFRGCCSYTTDITVTDDSASTIVVPQLAHVRVAPGKLDASQLGNVAIRTSVSKPDKGWKNYTKQAWRETSNHDKALSGFGLPAGNYSFNYLLLAPIWASFTDAPVRINSGENLIGIPDEVVSLENGSIKESDLRKEKDAEEATGEKTADSSGDSDGDGITDELDTDPDKFSNLFLDKNGSTSGIIIDRAGHSVTIEGSGPVIITVGSEGGSEPAIIEVLGVELEVEPGSVLETNFG